MKIIKLNAINSTNSFLKDLAQNSAPENFTIVVAKQQTQGRGQFENNWTSEPFKNLTFSLFVEFKNLKIKHHKYLNFAISLAIYETLLLKKVPKVSIKWPNDILSASHKICGILIENTFFRDRIKNTIVGIGLNVNQTIFPKALKKVTSLKLEINKEFDLDDVLNVLLDKIKEKVKQLENEDYKTLEDKYLNVLYKKNIPTMFKDCKNVIFMGMITGISKEGKLQILLEDDATKEFGLKEVSFL